MHFSEERTTTTTGENSTATHATLNTRKKSYQNYPDGIRDENDEILECTIINELSTTPTLTPCKLVRKIIQRNRWYIIVKKSQSGSELANNHMQNTSQTSTTTQNHLLTTPSGPHTEAMTKSGQMSKPFKKSTHQTAH